jgi:lipoate-protein ligase A
VILVDNRNSADPYLNLAIEEYLVRNLQCGDEDYLLIYINEPSVVMGKNQSIYKEVNFEYLRNGLLKLSRRLSGGGTVYHDEGNLNFTIISKFAESKINNYRYFNQRVVDALARAGVKAEMDHWNNIICKGKKISGNAQFTNRKNILSHGTVLLNADLATLRACLKDNPFKVESRAVKSVKSAVLNLQEITDKFPSTLELKQYLIKEAGAKKMLNLTAKDWKAVEKLRDEKFSTYEWVYGRSPHSKIEKQGAIIDVEEGMIVYAVSNFTLPELKGVRYEYETLKKLLQNYPNGKAILSQIF